MAAAKKKNGWPGVSPILERARVQAEWRINQWHELQLRKEVEDGNAGRNASAIDAISIGAATGAARKRPKTKKISFGDFDQNGKPKMMTVPSHMRTHTVRGTQSRSGGAKTIVPNVEFGDSEVSESDHWLLYLMQQVELTDPRSAYAAMVFAATGSQEAAWSEMGTSEKAFLKYFNGAIATIMLLERQKDAGLLDGRWRGKSA